MKVGFGTAIAGGVVTLVAGIVAIGKASQLPGECNGMTKNCDASHGGPDLAAANTAATVANVAFGVGAAGAFLGLIGLWRSRSTTATVAGASFSPWIGAGAAGLDGRF